MAGFGWHNPFPFKLGGGKTLTQTMYEQLRDAVGIGGWDPREDESIDGIIRAAKAKGLAAAASHDASAALQAFAGMAVDQLEWFERALGIVASPDEPLVDRQAVVALKWVRVVSAVVPELEERLQSIDQRFSILSVDWKKESTTTLGKPFEQHDGSDAFGGGRTSTQLPNYSSEFVLRVLLDLGSGVAPDQEDLRRIDTAKRLLGEALPSWMTFTIGTEQGFVLDRSVLDGAMLEDL